MVKRKDQLSVSVLRRKEVRVLNIVRLRFSTCVFLDGDNFLAERGCRHMCCIPPSFRPSFPFSLFHDHPSITKERALVYQALVCSVSL